jgi:GNAT superfamily N-acetyltransferase
MTDNSLIELNFLAHATRMVSLCPEMKTECSDTVSYADSGLPCDTFNIVHITDGAALPERKLTDIVGHFREQKSDFCIWITQENLTENIASLLQQLNLQQQGQEVGMILRLSDYIPIESAKHPHIHVVDNLTKLDNFSKVLAANWSPPDPHVIAYYQATADYYLNHANGSTLYTYYHDKKPIATVELFETDTDTIGIYGLATLEDARGQGIGSALMTHALNTAKERGFKQVVLQASESGIGIYKKLGFKACTTYMEFS